MTVAGSAAALTKAINDTTKALDITQASLDAKVTSVQASEAAAGADKAEAEGYRDTTAAHAASVASDLTTVQGHVTYQGISAILAEKAVTAVDVFVYDTSLDSDGGAWRKRCQHTSWYNEPLNTATRGARREFPAVAVVVTETNRVAIYDGDDPSLPMWMTFAVYANYVNTMITGGNDPRTVRARALNAKMVVGTQNEAAGNTGTNGLFIVDFIADQGRKIGSNVDKIYKGSIADRNSTVGNDYLNDPNTGDARLGSPSVYSVDVAVLPGAPSDPATGLPVPTILAVCGRSDIVHGISVLKDDGTVVDLVNYVSQPARAAFVEVGGETKIFTTSRYNNWVGVFDVPDADFNTGPYLWGFQHGGGVVWFGQRFADTDDHLVVGANNGLVLFNKDEKLTNLQGASTANRWQQMSAVIASDYTTGWLPGDVKAALLASIDQAPLNAGVVAQDDFDDGIDGWAAQSFYNSIVSANAGKLRIQSQPDQNYAFASRSFTGLEVGEAYQLSIDIQINAKAALLYVGYPGGSTSYHTNLPLGPGTRTVKFIARNSTLNVQPGTYLPDADVEFDNLVVERADHDRSVNNGHLVVNGTITRSPVADGAELVGYSGFSAEHYLEGATDAYVDTLYALGWERTDGVWAFKHGFVSGLPIDGLTIMGNTLRIAGTKPKTLIRLSTTVPTADQLAKIEQDERKLFLPGAQCSLYGTSHTVKALAHDPKTKLLHVGTSQGRTVFDGLQRVANTETPVTTAISAACGLIVEE
jgi:hypothetical protein